MRAIAEDLAGDEQRDSGFGRGVERQVEALFRADAAQREGEVAFAAREVESGPAARRFRWAEAARSSADSCAIATRRRTAARYSGATDGRFRAGYQSGGRCSVTSTGGPSGGRYAWKSSECMWMTSKSQRSQRRIDELPGSAAARLRGPPSSRGPAGSGAVQEPALRAGAFAGDDDGAVAVAHQRAIELRQNLFGAAGRIGTDRAQGDKQC